MPNHNRRTAAQTRTPKSCTALHECETTDSAKTRIYGKMRSYSLHVIYGQLNWIAAWPGHRSKVMHELGNKEESSYSGIARTTMFRVQQCASLFELNGKEGHYSLQGKILHRKAADWLTGRLVGSRLVFHAVVIPVQLCNIVYCLHYFLFFA